MNNISAIKSDLSLKRLVSPLLTFSNLALVPSIAASLYYHNPVFIFIPVASAFAAALLLAIISLIEP